MRKCGRLVRLLPAIALTCSPALAQEVSAERMRANILAQIRANERARAANGDSATRSIRINNHQDTDQPLYAPQSTAPAAPGEPGPAAPTLNLGSIRFEHASDRLTPASWPVLRTLATEMLRPDVVRYPFLIIGHTDSKGTAAYNFQLSQRRAASVVTALGVLGVETNRLDALGVGMTRPLADVPASDPRNRRVEIVATLPR